PVSGTWTQKTPDPYCLSYGAVSVRDPQSGHVFSSTNMIGGCSTYGLDDYDPATDKWTLLGNSGLTSYTMTAAIDPTDRYFVAVGGGAFTVYDLATGAIVKSSSSGDQTIVNG